MLRHLRFVKTKWFIAISCLALGAVIIMGIRFFTYKPDGVHYHANFAVYINSQKEQFKDPTYYTEVEACQVSNTMSPTERAHMHDNVNSVIHVEDHAVTWGQFFQNLGWSLGPDYIVTKGDTMYQESGNNKLNLLLNGQDYTDFGGLQNTVIHDQDKLLISFGDESQTVLKQEYATVPSTAKHYDVTPDPASCSGGHGTVTTHDRLMHML